MRVSEPLALKSSNGAACEAGCMVKKLGADVSLISNGLTHNCAAARIDTRVEIDTVYTSGRLHIALHAPLLCSEMKSSFRSLYTS